MARTPEKSNDPGQTPPSKAAKLSAEDEVALREIDEAVRQDDAAEFMRKYGIAIGGAVTVLLLGLGGYLFWDSQTEAALEEESEQIVRIIDFAESEDFRSVKDRSAALLDSETPGIRTSARLLQAAASLELDEPDRAIELYAQVAADAEAPQAMRDIALIRQVTTAFDDLEPADVIAKLAPMVQPEHAFYASAAELTALAHLEAGDRAKAGELFAAIAKDEDVPRSLRDRALQMTGQLGVDAVEDVDEVLEEQGVAPQGAGQAAGSAAAPS